MLPAPARMRRRTEFSAAVRHGHRAGTPALTLHVVQSPGFGPVAAGETPAPGTVATARIGFVIPRAVGPAVVRNRVRRRLRHLLRTRLADIPAGTAVVVRVSPPAAVLTSAELAGHLDSALRRALARSGPKEPAG